MSAPTLVQTASGGSGSAVYGSNVTEGNLLIAIISAADFDSYPFAISDTQGNEWFPFSQSLNWLPGYAPGWDSVLFFAIAKSSSANTVTSVTANCPITIVEYSASSIDVVSAAAYSASNPLQSPTVATSFATELLVGWATGNGITGANSPFSQYSNNNAIALEHDSVSSQSSYQSSFATSGGDGCLSGLFSLVAAAFPTISGNCGVAGATVYLTGALSQTATADGSGNYSFTAINGSYTVTPNVSGTVFSPQSQSVTVSGSNSETGVNFSAAGSVPTVLQSVSDFRLANVPLSYGSNVTAGDRLIAIARFASSSAPTLSDSQGNAWTLLTFGAIQDAYNTHGGIYTAIASATGANAVSSSLAASLQLAECSPSLIDTYTATIGQGQVAASSTIFPGFDNVLLLGWIVSGGINGSFSGGGARFATPPYTSVVPTLPFASTQTTMQLETQPLSSPASMGSSFQMSTFNEDYFWFWITGIVSLVSSYSISGTVGVPGAVVSYSGPKFGSVIAGSGGVYSIPNLVAGTYTITPSLAGYTFSPTSHSETITSANITGVNFTATKSAITSARFTFIERPSTTPGATTYDVMDGASTNSLGRSIAGSGNKVGELFFDPIVTQAWSFQLMQNQPFIAAGSSDALDIEYFATSLAAPSGITIVQPGPTPSTRFQFTGIVRQSGQQALQYLVSDGPSNAFGSIAMLVWDGIFSRWCLIITNASAEISNPADVACLTQFASSLAAIIPNIIQL